ncbi:Cytochrome c family protein [uncultured Candidatus Thioglobus sp.]|nr:Cytochrome c family protein [uncultured Candidatus Thioglobus sp.]
MRVLFLLTALLSLSVCGEDASEKAQSTEPTVTATVNSVVAPVEKTVATIKAKPSGKAIFAQNCQLCHGKAGQGLFKDWKKRQPDGKFPAPPLNGTAHTWHHSPKLLFQIINNGGVKFGGTMPGFKGKLSDDEKQAILDYLFSLWPQDIQQKYSARFK